MPELNYATPGAVAAAFMRSNAFVRGLRGPIGSGKSANCVVELFRRACEQAPNPVTRKRQTRWVVTRNTGPELRTTTIKTWLDWFPESAWGPFTWQPPLTHWIRQGDVEMEVLFLALDSAEDVKKLYSLEITGAWMNEARFQPFQVLKTLTERVGRFPAVKDGGATWSGVIMDTNSMDPDHWWPMVAGDMPIPDDMPEEEALMLQKPADWEFYAQPPAMVEVKGGDGKTTGWELNPKAENLKNLQPGYYPRLIGGKTRSEILRNVGNQIVVVKEGKSVYPSFSETLHFASQPLPILRGRPVYVGMDFGLTPAALMAQEIHGRWMIQRELVAISMGAKQFAEELRRVLAREYAGCDDIRIWGDPAGDSRAQTDEQTPFMMVRAAGLTIFPAPSNDFLLRVEAVENVCRRVDQGRPCLLIDPACRRFRKAMAGGYHYPKIQMAGTTRYADRPAKNMDSHIAEAGQYLLLGAGEGLNVVAPHGEGRPKVVQAKRSWSKFDRLTSRGKMR